MKKKNIKKEKVLSCEKCSHCVYIGEGDFFCELKEVLVITDFINNTTPVECEESMRRIKYENISTIKKRFKSRN